jgi:3-hydroxy acid dehydrogenase / malonic semialdehyde reductase
MRGVARTVLLTGASSGIGRAIARQLLSEGHQVIGLSRDIEKFSRAHANFHPVQVDLTNLATLPGIIKQIQQDFPALDAAVFAAGAGLFGSLEEFSYQQIQDSLTLNFTSNALITRTLISAFKSKERSDLIFIGSEAALKGSRKGTIYCAGKFALRGFSQALREECGKDGVRVCLINPGMVLSPFFDNLNFAPGDDERNYLAPQDVTNAVLFVLNSRPQAMIDEINLNPAAKVISSKKRKT